MRLVGVIMVVVAGGIGGSWMAARLQKRATTLKTIGDWLIYLQTEFCYRHTSLVEVLKTTSELSAFASLTFLRFEKDAAMSPTEGLSRALKKEAWTLALTAEDVGVLERMIEGLGKSSLDGQLELLKQNAAYIIQRYEQACEQHSKKGRVFRVMGVCAASAIALVLC